MGQGARLSPFAAPRAPGSAGNTRQWVVALAATGLLVALSVVAASSAYRTPEPLVEIDGGVMFIVGPVGHHLIAMGYWNGSELSVSDGTENVTWILLNESWEGHDGWSAVSFEPKNLSGLTLTPTIVDWISPGYVSPGDQVALVAEWNAQSYGRFTEGITYTMCLSPKSWPLWDYTIIDQIIGTEYTTARGFQVDFEFEDRRLSSECWAVDASGEPMPEVESDRAGAVTALSAGLAAIVAVYWFLMVKHRGGDRKNLTR